MPLQTMKKTTVHDSIKHSTIHHLKPPSSSILGAASKVVLYQKYAVSEDFSHSATVTLSTLGHSAQGRGDCSFKK